MRSCTCPRFWFFEILVSIFSNPLNISYSATDPSLRSEPAQGMIPTGSDTRQMRSFRSGLTDLLLQPLARITHTLVFIRVRRTQRPHFSCNLTNLLPVNSGQSNLRLLGIDARVHPGRQRVFDGMRVTETEHNHPFTLHLGAVANADDLQFTRPALGDAFDGVVNQGSRQPMYRGLRIILANRNQIPVSLFDDDAGRKSRVQLAL